MAKLGQKWWVQSIYEEKFVKRFWKRVRVTDGCWEWTGCLDSRGYGQVRLKDKYLIASRVAWALTRSGGMPDKRSLVCHKCDVPRCVNPDHLFLGTQKDNMADCAEKNRISRLGTAWKLHGDEAKLLQRMYESNKYTLYRLAQMFGVHTATVIRSVKQRVLTDGGLAV